MRKNSKNAELKEVKLSYKIDVHDYEVRQRAASKFIVKGDKARPCPRAVLLRPCDAAPGRPRGSS